MTASVYWTEGDCSISASDTQPNVYCKNAQILNLYKQTYTRRQTQRGKNRKTPQMNGSTGAWLNTPTVQYSLAQCGVACRILDWAESAEFLIQRLIAWHWCLIQLQASVHSDVFFFLLISEAVILQPVVAALILLALKLLHGEFLKVLEM